MSTFVFVHGSHIGGWIWERLAACLRPKDHLCLTPTLTGLADRKELLSPDVNLFTHIEDVQRVLEAHDLSDVVLVGHSYGGMVITGTAGRVASRIAQLVYLDAVVPQHGESLVDHASSESSAFFHDLAEEHGDGWRLPGWPLDGMNLTEKDAGWLFSQLTSHPYRTFLDRVDIGTADVEIPRAFVRFTNPRMSLFDLSAKRARAADWPYREVAAGHFGIITHPEDVASVLIELTALPRLAGST